MYFVVQLLSYPVCFVVQLLSYPVCFVVQLLSYPVNFAGKLLLKLVNFGWELLLNSVNFGVQLLEKVVNFGGQELLGLENFDSQVLLWLQNFLEQVSLTLKNFGWQVKNLCGQLVNWFERINHWFHIALPYLITIALFRALYIYYCYLRARKLVEEEEARKLKELLKREEAERIRLAELEKRKKQRVEEMREAQKKDLENTKLKEQIRAEVGKELSKLEETCHDMASVLRGLGITVSNGTSNEVRVAYKKALMKFHPDKTSQSDIRQQVEAEEKFKLISRMKDNAAEIIPQQPTPSSPRLDDTLNDLSIREEQQPSPSIPKLHVALHDIIIVALSLPLFIYCCYGRHGLLLKLIDLLTAECLTKVYHVLVEPTKVYSHKAFSIC
ncbi:hypothetical protein FXO37_18622 [Capsicum annuum]|nr:hypothetical protein FXO37_18622 [Capsicum annuum]